MRWSSFLWLALLACNRAATGNVDSNPERCSTTATPADGVVITDAGAVRGVKAGGTYAFKGVPYAAPPVGALRWRPPEPPPCWNDIRDASAFGSVCPQLEGTTFTGSEDCLTLNVWTPATSPSRALPVLVFMHGGFNFRGSASAEVGGVTVYDGAYLAEHGPAVVITINYRIGALGYLVHPSLEAPAGNFGLRDQIAALEWVKRNVAAFGGDPTHVMLFGQSAGSIDTCMLLASPKARGLFTSAMMLSGACVTLDRAGAELAGNALATNVGCTSGDVAACLRSAPASKIASATFGPSSTSDGSHPWIDGDVLTAKPDAVFAAGNASPMPVVVSTTALEMSVLATGLIANPLDNETEYRAAVAQTFAEQGAIVAQLRRLGLVRSGDSIVDRVLAAYPLADYPTPTRAYLAILGDLYYQCPARRTARALAAHNPQTYRAVFAHTFSSGTLAQFGAAHGFELFFGFHNLTPYGYAPTANDEAVAATIASAWTKLAAGEPLAWPTYNEETEPFIALAQPSATLSGFRNAQCDVWDAM